MEENGMKFSEEQVEDLTMALFEDADVEIRGAITFEALKAQLEKHDGLLENLTIRYNLISWRENKLINKFSAF
jgi:NADPH oxidase 5